jgi:FkbM family methyltransferase
MPNWRYLIGSALHKGLDGILSSRAIPLTRAFPHGISWLYDISRFAGKRDLPIIFDVGANIGQTTHDLVRYFPHSSIYCFEPVSESFERLCLTYRNYKNVRPQKTALGDQECTATIQLHSDSELNTLVVNGRRSNGLTDKSEVVVVTTVDNFCRKNGISEIDLLKMDVQGYESKVIGGAIETLRRNAIHFVYAEVAFDRADSDMQHFAEFNDLMYQLQFRLSGFYDMFRWGTRKQYIGFSNALYIGPHLN